MSHLSAERLAALADAGEAPSQHEAAHLAACADCARERAAYVALLEGARAERFTVGAPLTRWEDIAAGLHGGAVHAPVAPAHGTGLRVAGAWEARVAQRRRVFRMATLGAAAALVFVLGAAAGRLSAVTGPLAAAGTVTDVTERRLPPGGAAFAPVADVRAPDVFRSVAEAEAALARHEEGYQRAAAYLAENDTTAWLTVPDGYRARLVALESASRTIREAMEEAPYDPVLTGYYLTTLGQREATLRQLNVAVPASARLNTF